MVVRLVRVIAGVAKGRRLRAPPGRGTRPLTDRAKEGLFSSLGEKVVGARILDLFAGSGSLGIEALSRGAAGATFVERARGATGLIRKNLDVTLLDGEVICGKVEQFLRSAQGEFDLVFVDPPYDLSLALVEEVLSGTAELLGDGGMMVLHRRAGEEAPPAPGGTVLVDERRYGDTRLWLYGREQS
jgi:16S rRNA (guanine(966)-N(2))-methyltransferase RsmD